MTVHHSIGESYYYRFSPNGDRFDQYSSLKNQTEIKPTQPTQIEADPEKYPQKGKYLTIFQRSLLQKQLEEKKRSPKQLRRIQIMLLADEGKTQTQICQQLGCCHATARYWINIAQSGRINYWQSKSIGRPKEINDGYLERLKQLASQHPREVNIPKTNYKYSFKNWTAQKLSQHLKEELAIQVTPQHINRLLKQMGLSTRSHLTLKERNTDKQKPNSNSHNFKSE